MSFISQLVLIFIFFAAVRASSLEGDSEHKRNEEKIVATDNRFDQDGTSIAGESSSALPLLLDRQLSVSSFPGLPSPGGAHPSHVFFSADNMASLYLNGVFKASMSHWSFFATAQLNLKPGDVIAIKARDYGSWYGAIAALHYRGKFYVTGTERWKTRKAFSSSTDWMKPSYDACIWPYATLRPGSGSWNRGKSPYFPYYTGARYVWAPDAGVGDEIFLRFRIGGEACGQQ